MYNFMVRLTNDCNMNCSFCMVKEEMKNKNYIKDLDLVAEKFLLESDKNFSAFSISGGEPLSNLPLLEKVINVFLNYNPSNKIRIFTNGTYLTEGVVNTFNSFDNIFITLSYNGLTKGEKSVKNMIKVSEYSYGSLIEALKLKNKNIKMVIPNFRDPYLPLETFNLIKLFDCEIEISLDNEIYEKLKIDDIFYMQDFIQKMNYLGVYDKVSLTALFNWDCDCSANYCLNPDGKIYQRHETSGADPFLSKGCSAFRKRVGDDLYYAFTKVYNISKLK